RWRVIAFALSAGIAGLGGGLLSMFDNQANYAADFTPLFGLFWIVLLVPIGARTLEGAISARLALALFPQILNELGVAGGWQYILFGLGALTFAQHPEGILEYQKRAAMEGIQRLIDRRHRRGSPQEPSGQSAPAAVDGPPQPSLPEAVGP